MENAGRMRQYYLNFVKHDIEKIIETKVYKNKSFNKKDCIISL